MAFCARDINISFARPIETFSPEVEVAICSQDRSVFIVHITERAHASGADTVDVGFVQRFWHSVRVSQVQRVEIEILVNVQPLMARAGDSP